MGAEEKVVELFRNFPVEVLVTMTLTSLITTVMLVKFLLKRIKKETCEILRKIEWLIINQEAMDYALEKESQNGYEKNRDEKKRELLKKSAFIYPIK